MEDKKNSGSARSGSKTSRLPPPLMRTVSVWEPSTGPTNWNAETQQANRIGRYMSFSTIPNDLDALPTSSNEVTGREDEEIMQTLKTTATKKRRASTGRGHTEKNRMSPSQAVEVTSSDSETQSCEEPQTKSSGKMKTPSAPPCAIINHSLLQETLSSQKKLAQCQHCTSCGACLAPVKAPAQKRSRKSKEKMPIASPVPWEGPCPSGGTGTLTKPSSSSTISTVGSNSPKSLNCAIVTPNAWTIAEAPPSLEDEPLFSPLTLPQNDGGRTYLPNGMLHYKGG